jgi:hypothetical protein
MYKAASTAGTPTIASTQPQCGTSEATSARRTDCGRCSGARDEPLVELPDAEAWKATASSSACRSLRSRSMDCGWRRVTQNPSAGGAHGGERWSAARPRAAAAVEPQSIPTQSWCCRRRCPRGGECGGGVAVPLCCPPDGP